MRISFLWLLVLSTARLAAADSALWQLTFAYDVGGLQLVKAAEIPPTQKKIVSPGLEGAVTRLDYDLIWENGAGQVIVSTPVVVPLGLRAIFSEQNGEHTRGIPPEGGFVLRVAGPDPGAGPVAIRLVKRAAARANAVPGEPEPNVPPAFGADEQRFALPLAMARAFVAPPPDAAGPLAVVKLRDTGPDNNRLVVVIMCDGFTETDLASSSFSNTVSRFLGNFFGTPPWNSYAQGVNIYRVDIASNQSGADYEDAAPGSGGTQKDTYLNAAFWVGGTERCLFLNSEGITRASAAADNLVGVGVWDEILVFVNSTKYGGCGGSLGVSSLNSAADEVQIHEFGHSFAGLADEYDYGSTSTNCSVSARNVDCPFNFPSVKWDIWVTPGTPIPTPATGPYANAVGAFEGAQYQTIGIFRPKQNCKMRSLGVSFCPICAETHIMRLLDRVALADSVSPPAGPAEVPRTGTAQFTVTQLAIAPLTYQWELGGVIIPGATTRTVLIAGSQVTQPNQELKVTITHSTPQVRAVVLQDTYRWTLNLVDSPSLRINSATIAEPSGAPVNATFNAILSFAAGETVTAGYYVGGGTATGSTDYTPNAGILTFNPGQRTNTIAVPILPDALPESPEVFFVNLVDAINARIVDGQGTGTILDDDNPPTIVITNPAPLTVFSAPASIVIEAAGVDADGSVTNIDLFQGSNLLIRAGGETLNFTWGGVPQGIYTLQAIATDNSGRRATSAPVKIAVSPAVPAPVILVALDAPWRFDATTSDYGTAWKDATYPDAGWAGPSLALFYEEPSTLPGPKNTVLPLTFNGARIRTYYFRTTFDLPFPPLGVTLVASNVIDDGAVFWLNGAEVGRLRVAGAASRTTLASGQPPGGDASVIETLVFPTASLVQGENVLAVEVHQQSDTSSDVAFGMQLDAVFGYAPFFIDDSLPMDRSVVQGQPMSVSVQVAAAPAPRYQWFRNGTAIINATNANYSIAGMTSLAAGQYFCRITNQLGSLDSRTAQIDYVRDLEPPGLVYAYGHTNGTSVTVWFSEPVLFGDATRATNYTLTPPLNVTAATLSLSTNVVLTTSPRAPGVNYLLTVNYVRDRFSNAIPANTQIPVSTELALLLGDRQPWHYFQSDTAPDAGWPAPGFDASAAPWALGQALFDAKRPTRSSVPPNNEVVRTILNLTNPPTAPDISIAYYFRTHFRFPGSPVGARLLLRTLVDDGAVYYLNGREVLRLGMPAFPAPITYNTFANRSQGDTQTIYEGPFAIPTDALVEGDNVLSAEVHQANLTSSDATFAVQLTGYVQGIRPFELAIWQQAGQVILTWEDATAILQECETLDGLWRDILPPPTSPYPATPSATRFYRLRGPD